MKRIGTVCLVASCVLAGMATSSYAGDEYLITKKEFGAKVKRLRIEPVLDSLRESTVFMIEQIDKGFAFSDESMKNPAFASYIEQTKQAQKAKYFLAATVLKLYEKNSRDSIKAVLNGKVRRALAQTGKFALDTLAGASTDRTEPADLGQLSVTLRVDNSGQSRGKTKTQTCAVVLSAWVFAKDGKPMWHAQTEIAQILPDATMGTLLNDSALDDAIKSVLKTLIKY